MSSNSKILLAGFGIAFGLGSFVSYFLARLDLSQQPPPAIAASTPAPEKVKDKMVDIRTVKPVKSARELLEEKYRICVGNPNGDLSKVPDGVMNQVIQKTCVEKS
jgi:hypothetical protein